MEGSFGVGKVNKNMVLKSSFARLRNVNISFERKDKFVMEMIKTRLLN